MKRINLCPLSQNRAWRGRKFSTPEKKEFERLFTKALEWTEIDEYKFYTIRYVFHMSKASDIDNPIKIVQDCLAKFYWFNDNSVMKIIAEKVVCKKGEEYIEVEIEEYK